MQCPMSGPCPLWSPHDGLPRGQTPGCARPRLPQVSHTLPGSRQIEQMIGHRDQIGDIINFLSPEISGSLLSIQSGE